MSAISFCELATGTGVAPGAGGVIAGDHAPVLISPAVTSKPSAVVGANAWTRIGVAAGVRR